MGIGHVGLTCLHHDVLCTSLCFSISHRQVIVICDDGGSKGQSVAQVESAMLCWIDIFCIFRSLSDKPGYVYFLLQTLLKSTLSMHDYSWPWLSHTSDKVW